MNSKENSSSDQISSLHNQIPKCSINPKYLKEREKNFKFPHESQKDMEAYKTLSPANHLEDWARHFKHEYMKNFPKNLTES